MDSNRDILIPVLVAMALLIFASALFAQEKEWTCGTGACTVAAAQSKPQTKCPVMGGKINKNLFVDVKGYRLYACCTGCVAKLKADPDTYVKKIKANGEEPVLLASLTCACGQAKGSPACKVACAGAKKAAVRQPTIDTPALAVLIKSGVPLVLLDARSGKYDDGRRIPGAQALSPNATAKEAAALIKAKNTLVVAYCTNLKCPASKYLAKRLTGLGYTNVLKYPQGIDGWQAAGYPVKRIEK